MTFVVLLFHLRWVLVSSFPCRKQHDEQGLKSIGELLSRARSDKFFRHGYHRYYERELSPYRELVGARILEIGSLTGHSLQAWVEYFLDPAAIQTLDIMGHAKFEIAREYGCRLSPHCCGILKYHFGDQGDLKHLEGLIEKEPEGWDIVIDDGSHVPRDQLVSFMALFPKLKPGGLYVIEDLETSYLGKYEGGLRYTSLGNIVETFKDIVDVVMRRHFHSLNYTVLGASIDADIVRVSFGDGILFVEKRPAHRSWKVPYPHHHSFNYVQAQFNTDIGEREAALTHKHLYAGILAAR